MEKSIRHAVRVLAIKDNKIVCIKYKNINDGYFDIPGGKIEAGETDIDTCIREFKEETGMLVDDLSFLGKVTVVYPAKVFDLNVYGAGKIKGEPQEFDENSSQWISISELVNQDKRLAITHLFDDDLKDYLATPDFNITFTCNENHEVLEVRSAKALALQKKKTK